MVNPLVNVVINKAIRLPPKIVSHRQFANAIIRIRSTLTSSSQNEQGKHRLVSLTYYLLGWLVGDASKHLGSQRLMTANIELQLTRKHPDNLQLGEYVMHCLQILGIEYTRRPDGLPRKKNPNGFFWWQSRSSSVIGWLYTACLGLEWDERTTKNPVRMEWMLSVPTWFRIWFLRGLADSDGDVHFQEKWVDIATSPNTMFIKNLFDSVGLHTRVRVHRGYGYVSISVINGARIQIFNPEVLTYRRKMLEKLAKTQVFRR